MMGKEQYIREMWEYYCREKTKSKKSSEKKLKKSRQAGVQGQWQQESPATEYLEQVKCRNDTDCTHRMMKHGFSALKSGEWEDTKALSELK